MNIFPENDYRDYLMHYGIMGMKWGIRRYQNYDGSLTAEGRAHYGYGEERVSSELQHCVDNLSRSRTANLNRWGKSPDTNVLYVVGYSGSGKSTLAIGLHRNNDTVIHLDAYSEKSTELQAIQSKKFNKFLESKGVDYKGIVNRKGGFQSKQYWAEVDKLSDAIEQFGRKEFKSGNRVICEGVEIVDNWLTNENNNYKEFRTKPVIILSTNPFSSSARAFERDGRGDNLLKAFMSLDDKSGYVKWHAIMTKKLNRFAKAVNAKLDGKEHMDLFERSSPEYVYANAKKHEQKITYDVIKAFNKAGSKPYGLENRLKTEESIARKLDLGKNIQDAIRYTSISSEKDFVKNYESVKRQLEKKGYEEIRCKNYFEEYKLGKVKHKSVQCNFETKDGYTFEIQFHTKASQDAKNKKIPLYEEVRNPSVSKKRKFEIETKMEELAESVRDPKGIERIKTHDNIGSQRKFKNSPEVREAMRIAKAEGWDALTKSQKELLNELY